MNRARDVLRGPYVYQDGIISKKSQKADNRFPGKSAHSLHYYHIKGTSPIDGIADLFHLCLQLYSSFTSRHEAATGGLIPFPIQ